jgi:hypothetical protein
MVRSAAFKELVGKLKGTASYKDHDDFQASTVGVYKDMARLVSELEMKKD